MKDTLIEIKNNLQGDNGRVGEPQDQISNLEHKEAKSNKSEQEEEKRIQKNEESIRRLWDKFKGSNKWCQKEKRARNWKSLGKNSERKLP